MVTEFTSSIVALVRFQPGAMCGLSLWLILFLLPLLRGFSIRRGSRVFVISQKPATPKSRTRMVSSVNIIIYLCRTRATFRFCLKPSHGVDLSYEINPTYMLSCYGNQTHCHKTESSAQNPSLKQINSLLICPRMDHFTDHVKYCIS